MDFIGQKSLDWREDATQGGFFLSVFIVFLTASGTCDFNGWLTTGSKYLFIYIFFRTERWKKVHFFFFIFFFGLLNYIWKFAIAPVRHRSFFMRVRVRVCTGKGGGGGELRIWSSGGRGWNSVVHCFWMRSFPRTKRSISR